MGATFADDGRGHPRDERVYLPSWVHSSAESAWQCRTMSGAMRGVRAAISHDGFCLLARWVLARARCLPSSHGMGARMRGMRAVIPWDARTHPTDARTHPTDTRRYLADGRRYR